MLGKEEIRVRSIDFVQGVSTHSRPDGRARRLRIVQVAPPYFDVPPKGYGVWRRCLLILWMLWLLVGMR